MQQNQFKERSLQQYINFQRKANQNSNEISHHTIKISTNTRCWGRCGEKENFLHYLWVCNLMQPLWRTVQTFLKELKVDLPLDLEFLLLGIHSKSPTYKYSNCKTFKDVNVHSHVQSYKLVHVSRVRCHVHASLTSYSSGYFTVLYRVQYLYLKLRMSKANIKATVLQLILLRSTKR